MILTPEQQQQEYADLVTAVDNVSAEISPYNWNHSDPIEFTAHWAFDETDGSAHSITAFYYQSKANLATVDFDQLDWEVDRYEVD